MKLENEYQVSSMCLVGLYIGSSWNLTCSNLPGAANNQPIHPIHHPSRHPIHPDRHLKSENYCRRAVESSKIGGVR